MSRIRVGKRIVTGRAVPDIAADGDPDSGLLTGYIASGHRRHPGPYQTQVNAGTSLATPLVAGLVADAQQGQKSAFGFINPLIYRLAGTPAFHDILPVTASMPQQDRDAWEAASAGASPAVDVFDSQERAYTQQVTAKGYDTMTGVGTPNGGAFITGLRRAANSLGESPGAEPRVRSGNQDLHSERDRGFASWERPFSERGGPRPSRKKAFSRLGAWSRPPSFGSCCASSAPTTTMSRVVTPVRIVPSRRPRSRMR